MSKVGSEIPRVEVLGVGISAVNMQLALTEVGRWIDNGEQHYVCVTGVHGVMESQGNADLLRIHNDSGMTLPDGKPMAWAGRWVGFRHMERVPGPDLMPKLCELAAAKGWTSFFYGGKQGVAEQVAGKLGSRFPGLLVVGTYSPPFRALTSEERDYAIAMINKANPDLLWVGLSTPKQELLMASFVGEVQSRVLLGVGAAFDINAGLMPRAPTWMGRAGLEWLYRLGREPRRLAKRYLTNNPRFLVKVAMQPPRKRSA